MTIGSWAILLATFVDYLSKAMSLRQATPEYSSFTPLTRVAFAEPALGPTAQQRQCNWSHTIKLQNELLRP